MPDHCRGHDAADRIPLGGPLVGKADSWYAIVGGSAMLRSRAGSPYQHSPTPTPQRAHRWLFRAISRSINPLTRASFFGRCACVCVTMSSAKNVEALQPGFSLSVAFEALHSRLALEMQKKCTQMGGEEFPEGQELHKQISEAQSEVQLWRASMGEMLCGYERRKREEFARLREEAEKQAVLIRQQAEQQVKNVKKVHAAEVHELYDVFMQNIQQQSITVEFLASIQTRTNLQLQEVVEMQQRQIQELQATSFLSHLSSEEETAQLRLALVEKEDILASLKTEVQELIPKLHGYIDAREHLLTMTLKEKTRDDFQNLELLLRNEQRENAWVQRALKENKRKRAHRLSRLQQQVADLTTTLAQKDDIIGMLERGFPARSFPLWQPETTIC